MRVAVWISVATLCAAGTGCGASNDGTFGAEFETATRTQDLSESSWDSWDSSDFSVKSLYPNNTKFDKDPTVCSNQFGMFFVTVRAEDQKYYLRAYDGGLTTWKKFGDKQFVSSPGCAMRYPYPSTDNRFVLVGKTPSPDDRIWALDGTADPTSDNNVVEPSWSGAWTQVSSTQYTGGNGFPGVGAQNGGVLVAFMNSNRVHAHYRTTGSWSSRKDGPTLPTGVTNFGVPVISYVNLGTAGTPSYRFVVMTRGCVGRSCKLYWTYFNASNTSFDSSWTLAALPFDPESDPALEYDPANFALTVYVRNNSRQVMQTTVHTPGEIGAYPISAIDGDVPTTVVSGAPRAVFGGSVSSGHRVAVVRGYDAQTPVADRSKSILVVEDQNTDTPPFPPF